MAALKVAEISWESYVEPLTETHNEELVLCLPYEGLSDHAAMWRVSYHLIEQLDYLMRLVDPSNNAVRTAQVYLYLS